MLGYKYPRYLAFSLPLGESKNEAIMPGSLTSIKNIQTSLVFQHRSHRTSK